MKRPVFLFTLLITNLLSAQDSSTLYQYSSSRAEFQISNDKRIQCSFFNKTGDIIFFSDLKEFLFPYLNQSHSFDNFPANARITKLTDSSTKITLKPVLNNFKIYTLRFRNQHFEVDSILPDSNQSISFIIHSYESEKGYLQITQNATRHNFFLQTISPEGEDKTCSQVRISDSQNQHIYFDSKENYGKQAMLFYAHSFQIVNQKSYNKKARFPKKRK